MDISKAQWDRYVEAKRDLVALEREHSHLEERIDATRDRIADFEDRGVRFDPERGVICIDVRQTNETPHVVEDDSDPL